MKQVFIFSFMLIVAKIHAQSSVYIDQNNAKAVINDNGVFFSDVNANSAGYEIPAGSGNHTTFVMSMWMGGLDETDQLLFAGQTYSSSQDFFPGPVADDYNSSYYSTTYPNAIWKVTKAQINYHINNFTATGYVPDPAIANWPANGNVSEGIAQQLAPFVDLNNDQIYDPSVGDHPYIQGDQAVYVIMNDAANDHASTGGDSLRLEIHLMFYQFNSSDPEIENTTFMNVKLFNRSNKNYHDFYFGLYTDYDLGSATNDYIGSDSTRNMSFIYNGENTDSGGGSQPGYGIKPPAFGTVLLSEMLGSFLAYNNGGSINGDPSAEIDYYNYLQARWKNSAHVLYGGNGCNVGTTTDETNYMYSGNPYLANGWDEITSGNPPADRRGVMASTAHDLNAGDFICFDFAFIYNRYGNDNIDNVNELLNTADFVQNFYDNNIQPCNQIFLAQHENVIPDFSIYPNPSKGNFFFESNEFTVIAVYSLNGQLLASQICPEGKTEINLDLNVGMYIMEIKSTNSISYKKIEIVD